jgi:hypothetical protein
VTVADVSYSKRRKLWPKKLSERGNILVDLRDAVQMIIVIVASVPAGT